MARQRVVDQPAWVLHSYPWRETSLIVEVFAREHGRVGLVAKGARRPYSQLRGVLLAFQPLRMDWSGGGEVKTLLRAQWQGGQPLLSGRALLCAYYLNELLVRLLAREDPHPRLFDHYVAALAELARGLPEAPILRRFELVLLAELGYAVQLQHEADSGAALEADARYRYVLEHGPQRIPAHTGQAMHEGPQEGLVSGQTLIDLGNDDFSRAQTLAEARVLLRLLINHVLGAQGLHSPRVLKELQEL